MGDNESHVVSETSEWLLFKTAMAVLGRLCEFTNVRCRAVQFAVHQKNYHALKQTVVYRHNRP